LRNNSPQARCCLLCWFLDAGDKSGFARPTGRRPKSAKARSREKDDEFTRVAQPDKLAPSGSGIGSSNSRLRAIPWFHDGNRAD